MIGQEEITAGLNPPQLRAVTAPDGPLLILAGAGSGKTRVLTCRVAYLLEQRRAAPEEILAVTFTNKAAGEMKSRIEKLTHVDPRRMHVSTFHSFSARMLRFFGEAIGLPKSFTIYDEEDSRNLIKTCMAELALDVKTLPPRTVLHRISDAKAEVVDVDEYERLAHDFTSERVARVYRLYQRRLRECGALDFDDLLFKFVRLLQHHTQTRERLQRKYRYLLIDEYQDTNKAQYLLAKLLVEKHKNIFAVGDDDQSIYGWRGANIGNILDFEQDFPNCQVIRLEQNYRSTKTILKAASTLIANNRRRKGKTLFSDGSSGEPITLMITESDRQEAEQIANVIETQVRRGLPRREIAVLYRTNAQSRVLEESLKNRFIPYQIVGGIRFYQRKEIKDLLAYLKLTDNARDDVSFRRIVNYPKRGVGNTTVAKLGETATQSSLSLLEVAGDKTLVNESIARSAGKLLSFAELIRDFNRKEETMPLEPFIALVADKSGILADLKTGDLIESQSRLENVEELVSSGGEYQANNPDAGLREFLQEISLYTDIDDYNQQEDTVTLMTLHAAKGLEFGSVFISGLEEGLFPLARCLEDPRQLEEERRLMYVGMTRAKQKLTVSYALSRVRFGERLSLRSRFVDEIPDEVLDTLSYTLVSHHGEINTEYVEPASSDSRDPYSAIKVGSVVYHARWGEGKVLSRGGVGDSTELEVRFTYAGTKKLLARYAKLRLVR
jgi:DNA helicase-2/ATP-dependent DNA helicase PcrA